jgi:hypothetical protein
MWELIQGRTWWRDKKCIQNFGENIFWENFNSRMCVEYEYELIWNYFCVVIIFFYFRLCKCYLFWQNWNHYKKWNDSHCYCHIWWLSCWGEYAQWSTSSVPQELLWRLKKFKIVFSQKKKNLCGSVIYILGVASSCEVGNELLGSMKGGEHFGCLNAYELHRKTSAPCIEWIS